MAIFFFQLTVKFGKKKSCHSYFLLINFVSAEKRGNTQEIFPVQPKKEKKVFTRANISDPAKTVDQLFSIFCP